MEYPVRRLAGTTALERTVAGTIDRGRIQAVATDCGLILTLVGATDIALIWMAVELLRHGRLKSTRAPSVQSLWRVVAATVELLSHGRLNPRPAGCLWTARPALSKRIPATPCEKSLSCSWTPRIPC